MDSKISAEYAIFKSATENLKYRIFRLGRLSWRTYDGKFQLNPDDNEFLSVLRLFILLKSVPEELLNMQMEISPIDFCARSIVKLINQNAYKGVFHIMNKNIVSVGEIISFLNKLDYQIQILKMEEFMNKFNNLSESLNLKQVMKMCCVFNNKLTIEHNDRVINVKTRQILGEDFEWPEINLKYFEQYFHKFKIK